MDFDTADNGVRRALNVLGVAAVIAAVPAGIFGGGWLALAALGVAVASTGISVAMDAVKWECDTEVALCEACRDMDDAPGGEALATSQQPAHAAGKQWAASVAATRKARRSR
jgi:hypothetical protein